MMAPRYTPSARPSLTLLSTRIATYLYDRMHIYKASSRMTIQEITEAALTKYLDEVDPVGKAKAEKLAKIAAEQAPGDSVRLDRLERMIHDLFEQLGAKPSKKARA